MSDLTLYQITNAFPTLMEAEDITEENKKQIEEELTVLLQQKSQNIIGYTRNLELSIEAKKEEEKRIAESRKADERRVEKFKEYVKECMERCGITKIETSLGSLSLAKNPMSVEIESENEIPEQFKQQVVTTKIDKTAIKKHFKETGEIIPGAKIVDNKISLRIK